METDNFFTQLTNFFLGKKYIKILTNPNFWAIVFMTFAGCQNKALENELYLSDLIVSSH